MFGRKNVKYAIIAALLILSACSGQTPYLGTNAYTAIGASCTSLSTANSYRGDFSIAELGVTGYLQLAIINSNTLTSSTIRNFSTTGMLVMNGSQYCCTTSGATGSLSNDPNAIAIGQGAYTGAITSLSLICSSIGGAGAGTYGGGFYSNAINVVIPSPHPEYGFLYMYLTTAKRLEGFLKVTANYSSALPSINNIEALLR